MDYQYDTKTHTLSPTRSFLLKVSCLILSFLLTTSMISTFSSAAYAVPVDIGIGAHDASVSYDDTVDTSGQPISSSSLSQQDPSTTPDSPWKVDLAADAYELSGKDAAEYAPRYTKEMLPVVKCARAAVMDAEGKYVYGKNAHSRAKIASTTKIMCAIVACDYPLDMPVLVTAGSAYIPGSTSNLLEGDQTTIEELLKGIMLPSGNDAAYALAIACGKIMLENEGRVSEAADEKACVVRFVDRMNEKAKEFGMNDTLFVNPCGLDDEGFEGDHASSAYDVAVMTKAAYEIDTIREVVARKNDVMKVTRNEEMIDIPLDNTNRLLEITEEAVGMKTGFTDMAGSCVACVFDDGTGEPMFVSILGAESVDDSFEAGNTLYKWVVSNRMTSNPLVSLVSSADENGKVSLGRIGHRDWLDKDFEVEGILPMEDESAYIRYAWEDDLTCAVEMDDLDIAACGDVGTGDRFGRVAVYDALGELVDEFEITASEDIDAPNALEGLWVSAVRFFSPLVGMEIIHAPDVLVN